MASNTTKKEVIIFKSKRKTDIPKLNFKLCRKKLHLVESARYIGVIRDQNLNLKNMLKDISTQNNMR